MEIRRPFPAVPRVASTIDLGDVSGPEIAAAPEPVSPHVLRALRALVVTVLLLVAGVAAAPGTDHLLTPLWTRQASLAGFVVGPAELTMSDPGARVIVGRDPTTGAPRWQVNVPDPPQYMTPASDGVSAIVLRNVDVDATDTATESTVTLLITDSGTVLTRLPGNQISAVHTTSLLLVANGERSVTVGCPADADVCSDVAGFDVPHGREVWRIAAPGLMVPVVPVEGQAISRFVMLHGDGLVDVRSPADGQVIGALRLPPDLVSGGNRPQILLAGETLVTAVRREDRADIVAFAVGPQGHGWSASLPVTRAAGRFYLAGCGELVCLHADGADALFDLDSGALRGRVADQVVGQVGQILLAVPSTERPLSPEARRLVSLYRAGDASAIGTLPGTAVVDWRGSDGRALLARQGRAGTEFSVLDGYGGTVELGTVPGVDLTCEAYVSLLLCIDPAGFVRAWRLPARAYASGHERTGRGGRANPE